MTRTGFLLLLLFSNILLVTVSLQQTLGTHLPGPAVGVWSDQYKSPIVSNETLIPGLRFRITVNVTEVTSLTSYDITLKYFSEVLTTSPADVGLLSVGGKNFREIGKLADDVTGTVRMIAGLGGDTVTVETSSPLFYIDFTVDEFSSTSLSLIRAKLSVLIDGVPTVIDPTIIDGYFTNTGAQLPVASFTFDWADTFPDGVITQGETATFDASTSYDPDASPGATNNGIASYQWSFGDDTPTVVESDPLIDHVFQDREGMSKYGIFTVTLTVFDDPDNPGSNSRQSQQLTVVRLPTHDLAVTRLEAVPPEATRGQQVVFRVFARNIGTFQENFTVTLFVESLLIGTQSFENVGPDESRISEFTWDSTVDPLVYIITANVTIVPGETSVEDNSLTITFTVHSAGSGSSRLLLAVGSVVAGTGLVSGLVYILRRKRANKAES